MKYRVYIKQAKKNLLTMPSNLIRGAIDGSTGKIVTGNSIKTNTLVLSQDIRIDPTKYYALKRIMNSDIKYYIAQYDKKGIPVRLSNPTDPNYPYTISKNITKDNWQDYIIPEPSARYINFQITFGDKDEDFNDYDTKLNFMFLESSDPVLIHDSGSPEKEDHLINPILEVEDSSPGNFSFTISRHHPYYDTKINLWTDTIYITRTYSDGSEQIYWDGRPINEECDSDGNRYYYCEGAMAYLNDIRMGDSKNISSGLNVKATVPGFIQDQILSEKNLNYITDDICDRSFFSYRDRGYKEDLRYPKHKLNEGMYAFFRDNTKYDWVTSYESGTQWLNDIKDSFGAHMKILYRPYDSPTNDTICRIFALCQRFDEGQIIMDGRSWLNNEPNRTLQANIYYSLYKPSINTIKVYKTTKEVHFNSLHEMENQNTPGVTLVCSASDVSDFSDKGILIQKSIMSKNLFAIKKDTASRYLTSVHATFGKEIFSGKKTTSIGDLATVIIPRGAECYNSYGDTTNIFLNTAQSYTDDKKVIRYDEKTVKNSPSVYDPDLIKIYGNIEAVVDFESADSPYTLSKMSDTWFMTIKSELLKTSIEISLLDLNINLDYIKSNEGKLYTDPEYIDIWTQVYATIPVLGIGTENPEEHYYVSRLSIPLDDHLNTQITLSNINSQISKDKIISAGDIKGTSKGIIDRQKYD